ncbi:MAG: peptide deformylase [Firmicutes bacterium]|nr:peptide deformylase [Bacillota bacterium]MTI71228.1 peptide deformylase [Bacillota bacterium]
MAVREILLLGNPKLYEVSKEVKSKEINNLSPIIKDLHDTLMDFRKKYNAGRAIAAPQIGVMKRIIYMYLDKPFVFINPLIVKKSDELMNVWDDCMSFPYLLVKIKRHKTCSIKYLDENFNEHILKLKDDLSELLQHEYDHLNGVLAVSRAIDGKSFAIKSARGD